MSMAETASASYFWFIIILSQMTIMVSCDLYELIIFFFLIPSGYPEVIGGQTCRVGFK